MAVGAACIVCLAATAARSLIEFSPHELQELAERRRAAGRLGQILRQRNEVGLTLATVQVAAIAAFVLGAAVWGRARWQDAQPPADWPWLASGAVGAILLLLAAAIWLPWSIARLWADPFLYYTWPLWRAMAWLLLPLVAAARFLDTVLHRLAGRLEQTPDEESFEDDIRTIVTEGHREGLLEEEAREMIEGVIQLGDVDVSQIMMPRTDMVSMPSSLSWPEVLDFVIQAGHTRIPVFGKNRDDIVGLLHIKDLLPELAKPPEQRVEPWTRLLREPMFVPETKPVDALLQEFQRGRHHMAVVLDEYGGVSGLVTMEDVLEEIVGEIGDEYDGALVEGIRTLDDGACEVLGRVHVDEINERLGLELPEDADFDTIGGFVFSELGHIPVVGEQLSWKNVRITVLEATRRRIERLRIEVLTAPQQQTA
jgi:CBS domain containing-hemolysin-like protein